jgi:hypothetical protein
LYLVVRQWPWGNRQLVRYRTGYTTKFSRRARVLVPIAVLLLLGTIALADVCAPNYAYGICGTNEEPQTCTCYGAHPPTEGECRSDYTEAHSGIWYYNPCPHDGTPCTTLGGEVLDICTTQYFCRRYNDISHIYCTLPFHCAVWTQNNYAIRYAEVLGPYVVEPE